MSLGCRGLQAAFRDGGDGGRRRQESDERSGCVRVFGSDDDPGRKHRNFLNLGRQRSDKIYAGDGKQLADLLEADFGVSTRDHGADSLALDSLALARDLAGNPEARKQLSGEIGAAYAGGIRDGFSLQQRAFERLHGADVRLGRSYPHGHADAGSHEVDTAAGIHDQGKFPWPGRSLTNLKRGLNTVTPSFGRLGTPGGLVLDLLVT